MRQLSEKLTICSSIICLMLKTIRFKRIVFARFIGTYFALIKVGADGFRSLIKLCFANIISMNSRVYSTFHKFLHPFGEENNLGKFCRFDHNNSEERR